MQALIFSDLDGTLMDHEDYSIEPARDILEDLIRRQLTPIFNSSKTRAEIQAIQQALGLNAAFICENGAGLFNYRNHRGQLLEKQFGEPIESWIAAVHELRKEANYDFSGFSDWTVDEVCQLTGLDSTAACLARQREYSEPVLWRDTPEALESFRSAIASLDLQILEGGRFLSIQCKYDKSTAIHWLHQQEGNGTKTLVALGDSPNDEAMLNAAHIAVIVKSAKSQHIHLDSPAHIIRTDLPGPAGWRAAMIEVLEMLGADSNRLTTEETHG